jgi:hypothetical protein
MATSGSIDFDPTRDEIIKGALLRVGGIKEGSSVTPSQTSTAQFELNLLVKSLQNDGVRLWSEDWHNQALNTASSEVTGTDSLIYTCIRSHTSSADNKPITGKDYTAYWTQKGTTGGVWATSTSYTNIGNFDLPSRTVSVSKVTLKDGDIDYNVSLGSFSDYLDTIADKSLTGRPTEFYLQKSAADTQTVYLYPIPDKSTYVLQLLRVRALEDFDADSNTSDFPQRWVGVLVAGLAERLSHVYGRDLNERQILFQRYKEELNLARGDDSEVLTVDFIEGAF